MIIIKAAARALVEEIGLDYGARWDRETSVYSTHCQYYGPISQKR